MPVIQCLLFFSNVHVLTIIILPALSLSKSLWTVHAVHKFIVKGFLVIKSF